MAGVFQSPKLSPLGVPATPSITDASIQAAADEAARASQAKGRASTILTNPAAQREAEASRQTYLGGR